MWLEAAHIDKDAQSPGLVSSHCRRAAHAPSPVQRAAIAHSYIQNYNEHSVAPAPITKFCVSALFVC